MDLRSQHREPGDQENLHKDMAHKTGKIQMFQKRQDNMLNGVSEGLTERMERTCKTGQGPTLQNDLCEEKAHLWATSVPQVASIYKEAHLDFRLHSPRIRGRWQCTPFTTNQNGTEVAP